MALKDWKKIDKYEWKNKKTEDGIYLNIEMIPWEKRRLYKIIVIENNRERWYDNVHTNQAEALKSIKAYMRRH